MGATKLMTAAGGGITLDAASTSTDKTITIPADNGTLVYANSSGNVGIGTTAGSGFKLQTSAANVGLDLFKTGAGVQGYYLNFRPTLSAGNEYNCSISSYDHSGDSNTDGISINGQDGVSFCTGSNTRQERARIDSSGNLLLGGTTVYGSAVNSLQLQNASNIQVTYRHTGTTAGRYFRSGMDSGSAWTIYNDSSVGVYLGYGSTSWTANSDERLKTALTPFENALGKVCTLRTGTGRYLTDEETVSRSFLIAQDVQKVLPEAVNVQEDEIGTLGLQYQDLIPLLTAAIQELKAIVDAQRVELDAAKADIAALKGTQ